MFRKLGLAVALLALTLFSIAPAHAQESRASLGGRVTDPEGAVVPNAKVTVTSVETGVRQTTTTNATGDWSVKFLNPGHYTFSVNAPGFKLANHQPLELQVGDQKESDLALQVGSVTESVSVTSEAPLIDTTAAVSGTVITTKELEDLPTQSHVPTLLVGLTPGAVIGNGYGGAPHLWSNIGDSQNQINGSGSVAGSGGQNNNYSVQYTLDGSYDSNVSGQVAFVPPQDSIAEFRVQTNAYDASIGRQTGGTLNMVTKGGSKAFHGSVYEYNQNNTLNAHIWGVLPGVPVPAIHYNEYGATFGGPVWIPKLYDGRRRKTFFFYSYDGIRNNAPVNTGFMSLPTMAERGGDFSQAFQVTSGVKYQATIYDPLTIDPVTNNRQPFPGNKIPASRISPFAAAVFALMPPPDNAGDGTTSDNNNYQKREVQRDKFISNAVRLDQAWNNANHSYANISFNNWSESSYNPFGGFAGDILNALIQARRQETLTLDHNIVVSPKILVDLKYNILNSFGSSYSPSRSYNDTQLGLSNTFISQMPLYSGIPLLANVVGGAENGGLGTNQAASYNVDTFQTMDGKITQTFRTHTFSYGVEYMIQQQGTGALYQTSGEFDFGSNAWTCHNPTSDCTGGVGNGWNQASFVLGMPYQTSYNKIYQANTGFWSQHYLAGFFQDDWRATPKLTLNFGMRWDYQTNASERHNKAFTRYNPTYVQTGVTSASQASYASLVGGSSSNIGVQLLQSARPNVSSFVSTGAEEFSGVNGAPTTPYDPRYRYFQPRLGFAYQVYPNTVVRGGLGRFVQASFDKPSQSGFDANTYYTATNDNYHTQAATLANPFPNGLVAPTGSSLGAATNVGSVTSFTDPDYGRVYVDEASASIQQQISKFLVEIGGTYERTHGLALATPTNAIPTAAYLAAFGPQFDSTGRPLDTLSGNTPVTNPFKGIAAIQTGNSSLYSANTVNASQLLRPNPLVNSDTSETTSNGTATYYALLTKVERRYSNGFSYLQSFTWGRNYTQDFYLGNTSIQLYIPRQIYSNDVRFHYTVTPVYELPFGKGKKFLGNPSLGMEQLVGGWEFTGIYNFQSGNPIVLPTNSAFYRGDKSPDINVKKGRTGTYFDTTAFAPYPTKSTTVAQLQAYPTWTGVMSLPGATWSPVNSSDSAKNGVYNDFTVRNTLYPQTFGDIRQPYVNTFTLGVRKNFNLTETFRFQLRFDATNLFNHPQFGNVGTSVTSTYFGRLSGTSSPTAVNNPRQIEIAGKIYF